MDRLFVRGQIAPRICGGERSFAKHVVGISEPFGFHGLGIGQRFVDGFAGDELLAHQPHRHVHALADERLATFADQAVQ